MSKRLVPLLAFALFLPALAGAGCGEARDDAAADSAERPRAAVVRPSAGRAELTKQQFIARADAICQRMNAESIEAAKRLKDRSPEELGKLALALQARLIRELDALEVPPGDERKVRAVLTHLRRLQAVTRMLVDAKGEDALPAVAGIAIETDAVARAAHKYGLFRHCDAYQENPGVQKLLRGEDVPILKDQNGKVVAARGRPRPVAPAQPPQVEMRQLASALVPPGRSILRRQDCAGSDAAAPSCVTIELAPTDRPVAARRAEIARIAARAGWTQPKPTRGKWPVGLLVLHREDYDATVWLAGPDCTPQLQIGDGPNPQATTKQCVDTIMVRDVF